MGEKGEDKLIEEGIAKGVEEFEKQLEGKGDPELQDPEPPEPSLDPEPPPPGDGDGAVQDPPKGDPPEPAIDAEGDGPPEPEGEPTPSEPSETLFTVPDHKFFGDHRGQQMTASQLEDAGLLDKILTGAYQVSQYQSLYEESKEKYNQLEERMKTLETPAEPEPPELTPQQFQAKVESEFTPVVNSLVDQGLIEQDFAGAYAKKAALDEFRVSVMIQTVDDFTERLKKLEGHVGPWEERDQEHQAVNNVTNIVGSLIKDDAELCGGLADEKVQTDFFAYLGDKDRSGVRFTPYDATKQDIRGAWLTYLMDEGGGLPAPKEPEAPPTPKGQKGMTGTGGQPRGRGTEPPGKAPKDEFQKMEEDHLRAQESRFQ